MERQFDIRGRLAFATLTMVAITAQAAALSASRHFTEPVTFSRDIAPIIFDRCGSCHRPDGPAPFSLLTYDIVRRYASQIAAVTKSRFMPPWKVEPGYNDFVGKRPLSDAQLQAIQSWVAHGAPEGDRDDLPALPVHTGGWQIGTPDVVVSPESAYTLGPDGPDTFRVFVIRIPTKVSRYVKGVEFQPENGAIIHHADMLLDRTPRSRMMSERSNFLEGLLPRSAEFPSGYLLGWTPGQHAASLPKGLGWRLEPDTDLVVQLHMIPSGKPEPVGFSVGFSFTDSPPVRTPAMIRLSRQDLDFPAGQRDLIVTDSYVLPVDAHVLTIKPHAHNLARTVTGFAELPDGSMKWLIFINDWDFRWQHVYEYTHPITLPKGTRLVMRYTYDNSADNPRRVVPPRRVTWGPLSSDEMADLWIQIVTNDDADLDVLTRELRKKVAADNAMGYEALIRNGHDTSIVHDDLAAIYLDLGQPGRAVEHLAASIRLDPTSAAAHYNLALAFVSSGRLDEAILEYGAALQLAPNDQNVHFNLANALGRVGRVREAREHYEAVLRLAPDHASAHNNLGVLLVRIGDLTEAIRHLSAALRSDPRMPDAHYNLGLALQAQGQPSEAIQSFRDALHLRPDWPAVLADLAWVLSTTGHERLRNPGEGVRLAIRAVALTGRRDARALDVLGAAYASNGQFDEAIGIVREAMALPADARLAADLSERLALYLRRTPYHNPAK